METNMEKIKGRLEDNNIRRKNSGSSLERFPDYSRSIGFSKEEEREEQEIETTLTEEQIEAFRQTYNLFDKDNDGGITVHELGEVMKALGQNFSPDELEKMFQQCDTDNSGLIEFSEFLSIMQNQFKGRNEKDMKMEENWDEAFKMFDLDGDGYISCNELSQVLTSMGQNLQDYEIKEMIQEVDKDNDGKLSFEEFVHVMVNGITI